MQTAASTFGRPPKAEVFRRNAVVDLLRQRWLPTLPPDDLELLVGEVQLSLSGAAAAAKFRNKPERIAFLRGRNRTESFCMRMRNGFIRAHKTKLPARRSSGTGGAVWDGIAELVGAGAPARPPFPHQEDAWRGLTRLWRSEGEPRAGLLVLPTGSGKTFTIATWLLRSLAESADLRALWIADQAELLEQAGREFVMISESMPADFVRSLRVIHGGAARVSTLSDPDADIACITRQSLAGKARVAHEKHLREFLTRPTIVVVDEAHHAVAPTYQQLLGVIRQAQPTAMMVGLTATPWPQGQGMTKLLRGLFPVTIAAVDGATLIAEGQLARPVFRRVATQERIHAEDITLSGLAQDIPAEQLEPLVNTQRRNDLVVRTWQEHQERWGKTLVYATTIGHADRLTELFEAAGATGHRRSQRQRRGPVPRPRQHVEVAADPAVFEIHDMRFGVAADLRTAQHAADHLSQHDAALCWSGQHRGARAGYVDTLQ